MNTFTELGGRCYIGQGLAQMGQSLFGLGNEVEAERVWRESLRIAAEIRGMPVALEVLVGLANLRERRGDVQFALELILVVLNHLASDQETKNRAQIARMEFEARLTSQQIQVARAQARKLRIEQVIDHVLQQP